MEIKKVGVVGCGQMGSGITQVCAQAGYQVIVSEINDELLVKGLKYIDSRLGRDVEKSRLFPQDKESILSRIKGTTDIKDFADCDLMIEVAIENMDLKKKIFAELDKICPKHAILTTNTSCLSVIEIGSTTRRLDKVIGAHFFNPVQLMRLIELVRTIATSDETVEIVRNFGQSLGKTVAVAKDTPGFLTSRLADLGRGGYTE